MLLCLSIDHRVAGLPMLEQIERCGDAISATFRDTPIADGQVIVATCNRFEVYFDAPEDMLDDACACLSIATGIPWRELSAVADRYTDGQAAEHLFAVTSGLKSAVIGEGEIAGQVRRAHTRARAAGTVTDVLERLFQTAARASREVKHRTGLQSKGRSLVRLALVLAEHRVPAWSEARVLLIGTGAYAGATTAALRARGAQRIEVFSPSGRAEGFATSHHLAAVADGDLPRALRDADLVITCTSTNDPVLTRGDFDLPEPPRLIIDLGVPRNVDPSAAELPGIELLDVATIAKHASITELGAEQEALTIVRESAAEFTSARAELGAVPTVVALRDHVFRILEEELCRARRGGPDSPDAVEAEVALRRFAGRLLHEPSVRVRALGREGRSDEAAAAAAALFGVTP
ncbi:glutamyl-tRNA reductase [Leucobacter rhizosphaerae]|uniref:Glutamyl-tRNA reductase n=1 Tax=Leucobacter rhizosphaerae TaxID=2932245 RepID=A0ABY4FXN5_9MICO|nr:glutamyl-tRNA reductase [Leucobacter rhizosphaerae]UOQ61062.1 glutamyl-tRNA reductase [Leucobacter rhizosphaerae]